MEKITTCLWFDGQAEEAANFYVGLFPDSEVTAVHRAASDYPSGKEGDVLLVEFTLAGRAFSGLNGGPHFKFTEAISLSVDVADQAELDRYWAALSSHPENEQCGWCKDRYGLSWQIVPHVMQRAMENPDKAVTKRVFAAMMEMTKLDVAKLEAAERGE